jgi:hypothetical protein
MRAGILGVAMVALLAAVQVGSSAQAAAAAAAAPAATPRTAEGKPDFSGVWGGGGGGIGAVVGPDGSVSLDIPAREGDMSNFQQDNGIRYRTETNKPIYKPELWAKIRNNDFNGNLLDPEYNCKPAGVPRMGFPQKIMQTKDDIVFLYEAGNVFRQIPLDGRQRDQIRAEDQTWLGDSLGRWEGDTLVIETMGFTDEMWLHLQGYPASTSTVVTERIRPVGDAVMYQVTVEDPDQLIEPWVQVERRIARSPDQRRQLTVDYECEERDNEDIVDHTQRG